MYRSASAALLVIVVVVSIAAAGPAIGLFSTSAGDPVGVVHALEDDGEFDSTTFVVTVEENGDATWTFRHERRLGPEEEADFEAFAEEFREEETELYEEFTVQAQALADSGTDRTDREMEAADFNRSAGIDYRPNAMGYVEMSFTWTEFAAVDDGRVVVGDVFEGGLYIGPDQSFVVQPGGELAFQSVQPESGAEYTATDLERAESVTWTGERDFPDGQPRAVLVTPDAESVAGADGGDADNGADDPGRWFAAVAVLVVLLAVGVAAVWYGSGRVGSRGDVPPGGGQATDAVDGAAVPDEEFLTDEDRVVGLITDNGGRMKQVDIVEETGWSKSKVSMLLSEMEEEGTISKLRVGRENIISLRGHEPEATKSPFEE